MLVVSGVACEGAGGKAAFPGFYSAAVVGFATVESMNSVPLLELCVDRSVVFYLQADLNLSRKREPL
jgi:hypothetical protein